MSWPKDEPLFDNGMSAELPSHLDLKGTSWRGHRHSSVMYLPLSITQSTNPLRILYWKASSCACIWLKESGVNDLPISSKNVWTISNLGNGAWTRHVRNCSIRCLGRRAQQRSSPHQEAVGAAAASDRAFGRVQRLVLQKRPWGSWGQSGRLELGNAPNIRAAGWCHWPSHC